MAEPDPVRVEIDRFAAGGEGLGNAEDGRIVFVRGGAPGDHVDVAVEEDKERWLRGAVAHIHQPGPDRVEPPCPQRIAGCGGCDWQHLAPGRQLAAKRDIVADALRRTGKLDDASITLGASVPHEAYRTTIRVVGGDDGRASFRHERSHDTVDAAGCMVVHPGLQHVLENVRLSLGLELTLRISATNGQITARWDKRKGEVAALGRGVHAGPTAFLVERVAGHDFKVSAGSFFQSGPAAAELLVAAVRRAAPELVDAATVLDAYAGVGLFALAATESTSKVVTVETSRSAVADCRDNLADRNARVEQSEVGAWRPDPSLDIDVAIADPARSGLGRPGIATMVAAAPEVLVLVSCDPVAMARDTEMLGRHGYRHAGTEVLDLFPHTHHVECVTRFERHD